MPVLSRPNHEIMAQSLAKGLPVMEAFKRAGYAPHPANAARLAGSPAIKSRVDELLIIAAEEIVGEVSFSIRTRLGRIAAISVKAEACKDFRVALDAEKVLLEALGYKDNPSMVHDHLNTGLRNAFRPEPTPAAESQTQAPEAPVQAPRFTGALDFVRAHQAKVGGGAA